MQTEMERLRVLLEYWVKHNKEHGEEFNDWADRVRDRGVREGLLKAGNLMEQVNLALSEVLIELDKAQP